MAAGATQNTMTAAGALDSEEGTAFKNKGEDAMKEPEMPNGVIRGEYLRSPSH